MSCYLSPFLPILGSILSNSEGSCPSHVKISTVWKLEGGGWRPPPREGALRPSDLGSCNFSRLELPGGGWGGGGAHNTGTQHGVALPSRKQSLAGRPALVACSGLPWQWPLLQPRWGRDAAHTPSCCRGEESLQLSLWGGSPCGVG